MPSKWDKASVSRKFRDCVYNISLVLTSGEAYIEENGEIIKGSFIKHKENVKQRNITVYYNK